MEISTPKMIWGKVIAKLREEKNIALHITCGNIVDVEQNGNDFIIKTTEKYIYETVLEKKQELIECFHRMGYNYNIVIEKMTTREEEINKDIEKLKKLFKDIKIKE